MSPSTRNSHRASLCRVFRPCHYFEMFRVPAASDMALVVDRKPRGDRPFPAFVGNPVDEACSTSNAYFPIAAIRLNAREQPASSKSIPDGLFLDTQYRIFHPSCIAGGN